MPNYDSIEQCQREGFQDSLMRVVRHAVHMQFWLQTILIAITGFNLVCVAAEA